jgi:hypothetical protein
MLLRLSGASQRHNLIPFGGRRCAVFRPRIHQPAALLERRATPVCGLRLIFDRVRQRGLDHIAGKRRAAWQRHPMAGSPHGSHLRPARHRIDGRGFGTAISHHLTAAGGLREKGRVSATVPFAWFDADRRWG